MRSTRLAVRLCTLVFTFFASLGASAADPTVIVLSWDGIRWDYPDRVELPGLARMAQAGARGKLRPVYPSKTFPTHVSMATGTYPDRHGIMDNSFWDPETQRMYAVADADWIQAEPVWIAAERQGVPTATYFWVGSESDWRGQGTRFRIAPFDGNRREADKVAQYFAWLDLPIDERPRLIMSYWAGADSVGHALGPNDPAVDAQLLAQDKILQTLLAGIDARGLWPSLTLIIVSDHGMVEVGKTVDVAAALSSAGIRAQVHGTSIAHVTLEDPSQLSAAQGALRELDDRPEIDVLQRSALPATWRLNHPTRTGHLLVRVRPPYQVIPASLLPRVGRLRGSHGFDAEREDMQAAVLAMGRGVQQMPDLSNERQIDLAATIAALLGIDPPERSEGRPMTWLDPAIK